MQIPARNVVRAATVFVAAVFCLPTKAQKTVALTFDDLPGVGFHEPAQAEQYNLRIRQALKKYSAPAAAFVNERSGQKLGAALWEKMLEDWRRDGHDLGNHTFTHADLNKITQDEFEQEVTRGEATLKKVLAKTGKSPRYLRFPFNHTGDTREKLEAAGAILERRGYKVAACTIDTSDYVFARAYNLILARESTEEAKRLQKEYLEHTRAEIDYYTGLHQRIFKEEIPHVMLLHVNRLNADVLEQVLEIFVRKGYRFVRLEEAQLHRAYSIPITNPTKFGLMWGYRWAKEMSIPVDGKLEPEPPAWIQQYGR